MTLDLNKALMDVDDKLLEAMELNLYDRLYFDPALEVPISIRLDIEETLDKLSCLQKPIRKANMRFKIEKVMIGK